MSSDAPERHYDLHDALGLLGKLRQRGNSLAVMTANEAIGCLRQQADRIAELEADLKSAVWLLPPERDRHPREVYDALTLIPPSARKKGGGV